MRTDKAMNPESGYPEISKLEHIYESNDIYVFLRKEIYLGEDKEYKGVSLQIRDTLIELFVADEYGDLNESNQLLSLCLVLRELEQYQEAGDYLVWCRYNSLDPSDEQVRAYHMDLRFLSRNIESLLGEIDSCISNLDFELNAGAVQWLRLHGA